MHIQKCFLYNFINVELLLCIIVHLIRLTCRVRSSSRIVQTSRKGQRFVTRTPSRLLPLSSRSPRMNLFRRYASGSLPRGQLRSFIKVTPRNRHTMEGMPLPRYRTRLIYFNIGNKCNLNWPIDGRFSTMCPNDFHPFTSSKN